MKNLIIFFFILLVFSCKKKSEETIPSSPNNNSSSDCLISRISKTWDTLNSSSTICIYNSNNELIRLESHNKQDQFSDSNFYCNFSYSNGKLSSILTNNIGLRNAMEPSNEKLTNITEYTYQNDLLIEEKTFRLSNTKPKTLLGSRKYFYHDDKLKYSITDVDSIAYSQYVNDRPGLISYYLIYKSQNGTKTYTNYQNQKNTYDEHGNKIKVEETDTSKIFKVGSIAEYDLSTPALNEFQFNEVGFYPNILNKDRNFQTNTTVYSPYDCNGILAATPNAYVSTSKVIKDKEGKVLEVQNVYGANCPNPWKVNQKVSYQCK